MLALLLLCIYSTNIDNTQPNGANTMTTAEKNAMISARLLSYINSGATIEQAFGYVFGPGWYECLVDELYTELRAKATA